MNQNSFLNSFEFVLIETNKKAVKAKQKRNKKKLKLQKK